MAFCDVSPEDCFELGHPECKTVGSGLCHCGRVSFTASTPASSEDSESDPTCPYEFTIKFGGAFKQRTLKTTSIAAAREATRALRLAGFTANIFHDGEKVT